MWTSAPSAAGSILTRRRIARWAGAVLAVYIVLGIGFHVVTRSQTGAGGNPAVTDFNTFYAAPLLTAREGAAALYDNARLHPVEKEAVNLAHGGRLTPAQLDTVPVFGWYYPPSFLLFLTWLTLLPYNVAYVAWGAVTAIPYLAAMRAAARDPLGPLLGLAYPAALINGLFGQNGFLSAGLLGLGLALLDRRPAAAGICIGLLSFKPQLGVLIPLALAAGGHWRAFLAAGLTVAAMALASAGLFGIESWEAFLSGASRATTLMETRTPWGLMPTTFAAARLAGAPAGLAYALHGTVALAAAAVVLRLWRGSAARETKAAALCLGTLLATPFAYAYDLVLLALPTAWLWRDILDRGRRPGDALAITAGVLLPFATPAIANAFHLQIAPLGLGWMLWRVWRRGQSPIPPIADCR